MTLPQTPPARICAIVVTFNRLEKFRRTVERLLAEPLDQVLVIENGSTDGTREWLRGLSEPRLTVLEMAENGGGAQGFETGMREARNRCKQLFERIWRSGLMSRRTAYAWLASALGIPAEECHFGLFDIARCEQARECCDHFLENAHAT